MKKLLTVVLVIVLTVGLVSFPVESAANIAYQKISNELNTALSEFGYAKALVTLNDIDHNLVMKQFMLQYPSEFEAYMMAKFDVAPTSEVEITDELLQRALECKREIYRQYYKVANQSVIQEYIDDEEIIFTSEYSPVAVVEVTRSKALQLASDSGIVSLLDIPNEILEPDGTIYENGPYTFEEAMSGLENANEITRADYVRDVYGNSGSDVKVGIIEAEGIPDIDNPYLEYAHIYLRPGFSGPDDHSDHATLVASVIVGQTMTEPYGVAPDATLYCSTFTEDEISNDNFYSAIEWLINQGVSIINASFGLYSSSIGGQYNAYDAWIDHIAVMHDVHVVKSSGNFISDSYITQPGMGYNVITVGAINENENNVLADFSMPFFSNYLEDTSGLIARAEKPNLVAPGCFVLPRTNAIGDNGICGTSYAAPQVAGVIAQLCSYNSTLKFKQTAVGAMLMAGAAQKVEAVGSGEKGDIFISSVRVEENPQISDKEGAGILDARWARGIALSSNFWSHTIYSSSFPYTKTVTIDASTNTVSRLAIFWLSRVSVSSHTSGSYTTIPVANLDVIVYDPNGNPVGTSETTYANFEIVQFVPSISGTYSVVISGQSTEKEYIGIAVW